ncbi:MAG: ATP-binding protein [Acidimicrobiia bacterium]|nr:ATP-binding protein [Acidimicrobiia bacterium]
MFAAIDCQRTSEELDIAVDRLRQQTRWASWPNVIAGVALITLYVIYGDLIALIGAVMVFINAGVAVVAYRRAGERHVAEAAVLQVAVLWPLGVALGLVGHPLTAVALFVAVTALVSVASYLDPPMVLRLAIVSVATVAVACASLVFGAPLAVDEIPRIYLALFVTCGVTVMAGVIGLTVWHTKRGLGEAINRLQVANTTLIESERSLEAEVERRTAQLEQSQDQLADARDLAVLANARQANFLANVSHELRTPLNAIIGFSELLDQRLFGELTDKQAEYVGDIHQSGQHLLSLINDVLDLSAIDTGDLEVEWSLFDLRATVDNALVLMKERAARHEVALEAHVDEGVDVIRADERKLKQVLINLLSNAVKFTPAGGQVILTATRTTGPTGAAFEISVTDTGVGIDADDLALIFDEYRQTEAAQSTEGTGLGLALSRRIAEAHGGSIAVVSAVGEGSTFTVTLPQGDDGASR